MQYFAFREKKGAFCSPIWEKASGWTRMTMIDAFELVRLENREARGACGGKGRRRSWGVTYCISVICIKYPYDNQYQDFA